VKKNKLFYLTLVISIIPIIINLIAYPHLPNRVPVHWGISGDPNRYGTRMEQVLMSAIPFIIFIFYNYLPSIDPKREAYQKHANAYSIVNFFIILVIGCFNLSGLFSALGYQVPFTKIVPALISVLFIVLGNYMTQLRSNYFIGIRTPWALASEYVWQKTHRFGGYVFVVVGLIPLTSFLIGAMGMYLFLGAMMIGIAAIYIYSYMVFRGNA
jgi:uncharacterized membrane protein